MKLLEANWNPSPRELRVFSVAPMIAFGVVYAAWRIPLNSPVALMAGITTLGIAVLGLVCPERVRPVYSVWMACALPVGIAVSVVLVGLVYFAVLTPIGLALRLCGRDAMARQPTHGSDWIDRPPPPAASRYYRQF